MTSRRRSRTDQNVWGSNREAALDGMFSAMRDETARVLGRDDISIGTESDALVVGLPLPALCLRYLFQCTVFPLSRILQITGEEGSCKSAFQFEMMRWHHVYGGGSVFIENELKDSPTLRHAVLQYNEQYLARHEHITTYSLEGWMDALTAAMNIARTYQDSVDGPGHTVPIMFSVDSLMATAPEESIDKILKEGHAMRGFALAANLISTYMKTMPRQIQTYPFTICGTNHLKPGTDYMGRPTASVPGGKSVKFMETYEIEMHRAPSGDIDKLDYGGIRCKMITRKNSLGPSRKQIMAEFLWWRQDVRGRMRQCMAWDWDTATVNLLLSFATASGKKTIYNELMDVCRISAKNKQMAKCPTLGIDDYVEYRVIGAALERRPDLLSQMYNILGIEERRAFRPGMDYRDLLTEEVEAGEQAAQNLYENIDNMPTPDPDILDLTGSVVPPEDDSPAQPGEEGYDDGLDE